ncbi:conserved protein of unknown function [Candidatus Nitrotoga arctica]|uniref:Uncharacterized protein n=1 Tax=Candidatus Nitrotoga arctica TaxID=453162 RepID=A0ABM8YZC7_9PROT|nr:conserved protein of unknown function [Candidatus Nitrotoga arctica]
MIKLIQRPIQSCHLQALSSVILNTEVKESPRLRFQTVASEMSVYRDSVHEEIEYHMFNHFCGHMLPVRFFDG